MRLQGLANWIGQCIPVERLLTSSTRLILKSYRRTHTHSIEIQRNLKNESLQLGFQPNIPSTSGITIPDSTIQTDASLRGGTSKSIKEISQSPLFHNVVFHLCFRTLEDLVCPVNYSRQRCHNNSPLRQHHSLTSGEGRITKIPSSLPSRVDLKKDLNSSDGP